MILSDKVPYITLWKVGLYSARKRKVIHDARLKRTHGTVSPHNGALYALFLYRAPAHVTEGTCIAAHLHIGNDNNNNKNRKSTSRTLLHLSLIYRKFHLRAFRLTSFSERGGGKGGNFLLENIVSLLLYTGLASQNIYYKKQHLYHSRHIENTVYYAFFSVHVHISQNIYK
jgi:hypothetical protein